jgi:hypothetical protein
VDSHNESNAKLSNKFISKRISDDSMSHLLLSSANYSPASANYIDPLSSTNTGILLAKKKLQFPNQNCEVYEDINLHSIKGNEYCYLPAPIILQNDGFSLPTSPRTSSSSNDSRLLDNEIQPSTSKSTSQSNSPNANKKNLIPCPPKTLPPDMGVKVNAPKNDENDENDDYDVPDANKITPQNEYTTYLVKDEIGKNVDQEECLDYQVPINIPKTDKNE